MDTRFIPGLLAAVLLAGCAAKKGVGPGDNDQPAVPYNLNVSTTNSGSLELTWYGGGAWFQVQWQQTNDGGLFVSWENARDGKVSVNRYSDVYSHVHDQVQY